MSFRRENGRVHLDLDQDDYDLLLISLGMAIGVATHDGDKRRANSMLALVNRINEGNPDFWPYAIDDDAPAANSREVVKRRVNPEALCQQCARMGAYCRCQ